MSAEPANRMDAEPAAGTKSEALFERAQRVIPGGVNSPVRAYRAVGGNPPFLVRGEGCSVFDADGRQYIDYVGSWGPMLFGHAEPSVIAAVIAAARNGTSFGAPTEAEVLLAERITSLVPTVEKVRLVNSGTEAAMSAIRLARAATGRPRFVKFEGCYHGHADAFLIRAGSGAATIGVPSSPGVPQGTAQDTLSARYNDNDSVCALFRRYPEQIAAVIVEPVAGNMGCVPPSDGFLQGLRRTCEVYGAILIFDEVITGFRLMAGGAQELYGVRPDLTVMGKILGGGLPLAAYGGRADLMEQIAPAGPVYQAGTLSGNPLATAAGLAMLEKITQTCRLYEQLDRMGARLSEGIGAILNELGAPATQTRVGSMFTLFFKEGAIRNWEDVRGCDTERFARFFRGMLRRGIYLAPSQFETGFISHAHQEADIDATIAAARESLREALA
jgi:glutamate-1-semialdehyde 2,1-aminomutase